MKTLTSTLGWASDLLNGAILGTLGGVLVAHSVEAIQAQPGLCLWFIGTSLSAWAASVMIRL